MGNESPHYKPYLLMCIDFPESTREDWYHFLMISSRTYGDREMEPLSLGILGLLIYVGDKFASWAIEKGFDNGYDEIIRQMEAKSPNVVDAIALPPLVIA